jgi:hypothetical protein
MVSLYMALFNKRVSQASPRLPPVSAGFSLGLLFDPGDRDDMFSENSRSLRTTQRYKQEDRTLHRYDNFKYPYMFA